MSTHPTVPMPHCHRCGKPAQKLWLCETCRDEMSREGQLRIAWTVATCARLLATCVIACMQVNLSHGRDTRAMAKAMRCRDEIGDLARALERLEDG